MAVFGPSFRVALIGFGLMSLTACQDAFDFDFRRLGQGFSTTGEAQVAERPDGDNRGVISYPSYQVAVAREGDTLRDISARVGLSVAELSRFNGLPEDVPLRAGELIALPSRVEEPSPATGAVTTGPIATSDVDITSIAGGAIDQAEAQGRGRLPLAPEPVRHKVARGETAYSISRRYDIPVSALVEWNGIGSDFAIREGQFLLIPPTVQPAKDPGVSEPGAGSASPKPPSSVDPLPDEAATLDTPKETPDSPDLATDRTAASDTGKLALPVVGKIIRGYAKGKNDGIDIAADAGTPVKSAGNGTVAAITRDTDQIPILVIRHPNNLLTVYAGVDIIRVSKGQQVKRGQTIGEVRKGTPSFLHFEVREGFESVDPNTYLQ
ncbi:MAG: peptidoglycan DD-metalloendopeptidase family protein [Rhodobacteraceae bacterium]|nr:peptidoglycan DD-metalloendopeptidase family protein [Paracoccaceae bacterium]